MWEIMGCPSERSIFSMLDNATSITLRAVDKVLEDAHSLHLLKTPYLSDHAPRNAMCQGCVRSAVTDELLRRSIYALAQY